MGQLNCPPSPRRVTAQILRALLANQSFSALARRVQVATTHDAVVLRGAVRSDEVN
jgi:osmotically-inducible protein OsmY